MGVEYLPQFQSVTNVMNTEYGENNNLLTRGGHSLYEGYYICSAISTPLFQVSRKFV